MDKFDLLCNLQAISNFAYDIHYTAKGRNFYSDHIFSERLADVDVMDDFIETFYLGESEDAPDSSKISSHVAEITPKPVNDTQMNFKTLREMIVKVLIAIQNYKGTKGEEDLLGSVAHILQRHNGLLFRELIYTPEEIRNSDEEWENLVTTKETMGGELNNEKWITVHPNKENPDDYRRLKVEDGETSEEAVERKYGKDKKDKEPEKEEKKEPEKEDKEEIKEGQKLNPKVAKYMKDKAEREKSHRIMWDWEDRVKAKEKEELDKNQEYQELSEKIKHPGDLKFEEVNKLWRQRDDILKEVRKNVRESFPEYNKAYLDANNFEKYSESRKGYEEGIREIQTGLKDRLSEVSKDNEKIYQSIVSLGDDISNLEKEHKEARQKYDDMYIQEIRSGKDLKEINAATEPYHEKAVALNKKLKETREKIAKEVGNLLREKDGVEIKFEKSSIKDLADRMNEVFGGVLPRYMEPDVLSKVSSIRGRAHYSGNTLSLSSGTDIQTAIHEYMHFIEDKNPQMLANSIAFLRYRTEGEKLKSLKTLTGLSYGTKEKARPDKFFNPYCGKTYAFAGETYNEPYLDADATEIMSMGVEELFKNPVEFAKNDREYFDFVIANLKGKL